MIENPYINKDVFEKIMKHLPKGHPMRQPEGPLTKTQRIVLPSLMWFFDAHRNRAEGRTHLLAHVCIQLAMLGNTVNLKDVSCYLTGMGTNPRNDKLFLAKVARVATADYSEGKFTVSKLNGTLKYHGPKSKL